MRWLILFGSYAVAGFLLAQWGLEFWQSAIVLGLTVISEEVFQWLSR